MDLSNGDIAEIWAALGDEWRAALYRDLHADDMTPDPDALTLDELTDRIGDFIDRVPESAGSAKHGEDCWKRHAACLADRIGELLPR